MTRFLEVIDWPLWIVTKRIVRWWTWTTGQSNIRLAMIACALSAAVRLSVILYFIYELMPLEVLLEVFLLLIVNGWGLYRLIRIDKEWRDREALPILLLGLMDEGGRCIRVVWVMLSVIAVTLLETSPFSLYWAALTVAWVLYALHLYFAAHIDRGGKSKLKEKVLSTLRSLRSIRVQSPLPAPSPA